MAQWLHGQREGRDGQEWVSAFVRLSTARVLQAALEPAPAETLGRARDERPEAPGGYRTGDEAGPVKTAEGGRRLPVPPGRGLRAPSRAPWWGALGRPRDVLATLSVERDAGGMAPRDRAEAREKALGPCVMSTSALSDITDRLAHASEAFRTRDLRGDASADGFIDTVEAPLRRWGSTTGVWCGWGSGVDGRQGLRRLSTAPSASDESGLAVLRDLAKRGLQTPVTITTDGAPGRLKAIDFLWPRSLRMRCWCHQLQHLAAHVPAQAWPAFQAWVVDMRAAPRVDAGPRRFEALLAPYQPIYPEACRCLRDESAARRNPLTVPARHPQEVRTSQRAERACEEERRRTTVMPHLWDAQRLLTLVFAVLMRVGERWGKKPFRAFEQHHMRALRQT